LTDSIPAVHYLCTLLCADVDLKGANKRRVLSPTTKLDKYESTMLSTITNLKTSLEAELDRLELVKDQFSKRMCAILDRQKDLRPLTQEERDARMLLIDAVFQELSVELRARFLNAVRISQSQTLLKSRKYLGEAERWTNIRRVLATWYQEHEENPYPTQEEKNRLMALTGLSQYQLNNW
jgi:Homeobox KN domain